MYPIQRLSRENYMKTTLHFCREDIPDVVDQKRVVYFIRNLLESLVDATASSLKKPSIPASATPAGDVNANALNPDGVPTFVTIEEAEEKLPDFIGFGVYNGPALKALRAFTEKVRRVVGMPKTRVVAVFVAGIIVVVVVVVVVVDEMPWRLDVR